MCGRYATTRSAADLSALFESFDDSDGALVPDYNVAPTDPVPIVRMSQRLAGRALSAARWGLVPPWSKDAKGAARMINARAETVADSKAYAPSFARRRCLVPADGWYEWLRLPDGRKQAYFMTPAHGGVLALAGLWAPWGDMLTFSVVTTAAIGDLALVHDRMPLLLPWQRWAGWPVVVSRTSCSRRRATSSSPSWRSGPSGRRWVTSATTDRSSWPGCRAGCRRAPRPRNRSN
jgi:putative SOS response-associated peptidase YedK